MNPQKYNMSCGLACVAHIVKKPEEEVITMSMRIGPRNLDEKGFGVLEIQSLLDLFGYKSKISLEDDKTSSKTIVFTLDAPFDKFGHYVVKEGKTLNPWINFPNLPRQSGESCDYKPTYVLEVGEFSTS